MVFIIYDLEPYAGSSNCSGKECSTHNTRSNQQGWDLVECIAHCATWRNVTPTSCHAVESLSTRLLFDLGFLPDITMPRCHLLLSDDERLVAKPQPSSLPSSQPAQNSPVHTCKHPFCLLVLYRTACARSKGQKSCV